MEHTHFSVIPLSRQICSESVRSMIAGMGYQVDIKQSDVWVNSRELDEDISVLLLDNESTHSDEFRKCLNRANRTHAFAIIGDEMILQDFNLLKICEDFTTWPCHEQELGCRLSRLSSLEKPVVLSEADTCYEEFSSLNLVGKSPRFSEVLQLIRKMASNDAAVLIEGETGTGKEVTARAIHYLGARRDHPFVPVNCGAIPDNLLENELFGHEKGAFTDAKASQVGLIAEANGGTLFLDEIDAMSPKAQVSLLRFLQDKQYRPLGAKQYLTADVRIIAATNADMRYLVEQGRFREDLFFRINILSMKLPSLRERAGDTRLLAYRFVENYKLIYQQPGKYLHASTLGWLENQSWPGNIRELENTIHRLFLLADSDAIEFNSSDSDGVDRRSGSIDRRMSRLFAMSFNTAKANIITEFEKKYLTWLIHETHGNVSKAARIAGKERRALGKLLKKYQIQFGK